MGLSTTPAWTDATVIAEKNLAAHAPDGSRTYWPFQFGVRLLRNASIPSRKSSLI
ncbi:hypothetical protein SAMN05444171_0942 [Bradyrhizobium lablabi]|uniref:Uncharacterized protein n=2 Tax=Bradyrhizobium TaxID=374 RepID=A0ABY0Q8M8_9BRAD|nr:hypothetical protein SAMN05444163_6218 [Bradyrhizobium ottawaense]SEC23050.1 hypothetical protein SAMN05444171_0942 [Bradyrhizobium lablabi]